MIRSPKPWAWVVILGLTLTALVAGGTPAAQAQEPGGRSSLTRT
jgi:hypothetical protein